MNRIKIRWHAILIIASLAGLLGCGGLGAKQQAQTPGQLTPAPISISFGNVQIGTTQTVAGSVSNTGGSSITVSAVTVTGTGYSITGMGQSFTLAPGQNANFSALFAPTSPGTAAGSVAFVSSSGTANVPLSGTGMAAGDLTTNPTSISFGNVLVGSKSSQTETLKNTGSANLTVTAAAISGAGLSYAGLSLPLTLAPNQASTFGISFTPTVAGASNGELSLTVSGSQATVDIALSGNGNPWYADAKPGEHSVWQRSSWQQRKLIGDADQHRRIEPYDFGCRCRRRGIQFERTGAASDITRRPEHILHSVFQSSCERRCQREREHHVHRIESQLEHSAHGNGRGAGNADCESRKPRIWQRADRKQHELV